MTKTILTLFSAIFVFVTSATTLFAYQIHTQDTICKVFKDGKIESDTSKYRAIYEVDEQAKTITLLKEIDMRNGEEFASGSVYVIVDQPTVEIPGVGRALRALRVNPSRANIETISFYNGTYNYSKTTEDYINLFYGTYEVVL